MNNPKLVQLFRIILSILFIFSAISKLVSLPFFDGMVAELLIGLDYYDHPQALWYTQLFTRILISGELLLGAALLQEKHLKKIILPVVQFMLLVFTLHLFYEGNRSGFIDGNCGCFGDVLPMTNLESIIKNIVAMFIGLAIWKYHRKEDKKMQFKSWVMPIVIGTVCLATLFLSIKNYAAESDVQDDVKNETIEIKNEESLFIDTLVKEKIQSNNREKKKTIIKKNIVEADIKKKGARENTKELSADEITKKLLQKHAKFNDGTKINLNKGEQLVCLFSLTCSHCQQAYRELCAITNDGKLPQIYLFTYGTEFNQNFFFNQAEGCKHPYTRTENYTEFKRMLEGEGFPRILVFKDGVIVKKWVAETFSEKAFRDYFGIAKQEKKKDPNDGIDLNQDSNSPWGSENSPWE